MNQAQLLEGHWCRLWLEHMTDRQFSGVETQALVSGVRRIKCDSTKTNVSGDMFLCLFDNEGSSSQFHLVVIVTFSCSLSLLCHLGHSHVFVVTFGGSGFAGL